MTLHGELEAMVREDRTPSPPADLDPLATPALRRVLPGIVAALDPTEMAARLQSALFGTGADAPVVEACEPGKAMYLGAEGCRVRYELTVREPSSGQRWQRLVLGRLLRGADEAAAHLGSLEPLAAEVRGRPEVAGLVRPTALLADLAMVVHAFPIDGDLPALVPASDTAVMGPVLAEALGDEAAADGWRIETGHYGRRHRCVLRYEREAGSGETTVVYGKLCWDRSGAQLVDGFAELQARLADAGVRLPSLLAYRPELGLTLLAELPGTPLFAGLRRRKPGRANGADAAARLPAEVAAAGRVAAALHGFPARWGRDRPFAAEVADLRAQVAAMAAVSPELAGRLDTHLDAISAAGTASDPVPLGQAHGDFTFSQLLDDDGRIGLLDFDSLCRAEPGLDLGQFLAYLRLAAVKASAADELVEALEAEFRTSYAAHRDEPDGVEAYAALSLLRITVHGWQKLKASRAGMALSILERSTACRS